MGGWLNALPGAVAQGMIWGIMAIGVYITYKILDIADLTVDGSVCTGAAVCTMLMLSGVNVWLAVLAAILAGMLAGLLTGIFHTFMGIPAILAGILTQLILWSVNLKIMGKSNQSLPARSFDVLVTQLKQWETLLILVAFCAVLIAVLYWFFGTELGSSVRATGCNIGMSRAQGINTDFNKILGLMISNGIVALSGGAARAVSGRGGYQHGTRRHCHGACGRHHRRGGFLKGPAQFRPSPDRRCSGRRHLLYRISDGYLSWI